MKLLYKILLSSLSVGAFLLFPAVTHAAPNIDATDKWAWAENGGWINFNPTNGDVEVTDTLITGHAWMPDHGWINLQPTGGGVTNTTTGDVGGTAWGETIGYIDFTGVTINGNGEFIGTATNDVLGTISFNCLNNASCGTSDYRVKTTWIPQVGGTGCSSSGSTCYISSVADSAITNCIPGGTDLNVDYEVAFDLQYYADATDAGSSPDYESKNWVASVSVTDDNGATGTNTATTEVATLAALDVTSPIDYGSVSLGGTSAEQTITITNTGNANDLDPTVEQSSDWTCTIGSIDKGNLHWNTTASQSYGSGTPVSASATDLSNLSIQKFGGVYTKNIYTQLQVPLTGVGGSCSSTLSFTAVAG